MRLAGQPAPRGFTLVEVMVALAIVAIALPALMFALSRQADDTGYLRDKSLARMVAENKLAEKRLRVYAQRQLQKGKDSGVDVFAGRDWYWWMETATTEVPQFFRIEIDVALTEDGQNSPAFSLVSFMQGDLVTSNEGRPAVGDDTGPVPGNDTGTDAGADRGGGVPIPEGEIKTIDPPEIPDGP